MWFFGPDLLAHLGPVDVKGQWLKGRAAGRGGRQACYGLDLKGGGYLEVDVDVARRRSACSARGEYRDAFVWLGDQRAYLTKTWRATFGAALGPDAARGAQGRVPAQRRVRWIPNIANDVLTSSLVMGF